MIKPKQIPDEVETAMKDAMLREGSTFKDIAAAALTAWPGMTTEFRRDSYMGWDGNLIILPLTEKTDDKA